MKERIRRVLIFVTIVGAGTLLVLFDLPLLMILPLIFLIGGVLLILIGAVTVAEIKALWSSLKNRRKTKPDADSSAPQAGSPVPAGGGSAAKKRFPFSLGALFQKKPVKPVPVKEAALSPKPAAGTKGKISDHVTALVSSVKALGTLLTSRKKTDPDKLKKIDNLLDAAVSEKSGRSMQRSPGILDQIPPLPGTGALPGEYNKNKPVQKPTEDDPFLSLSNDELESGLLDNIEDEATPPPAPSPAAPDTSAPVFSLEVPLGGEGTPIREPDIPLPPQEISSSKEDMLLEDELDFEDLSAFEGLESVDENLGELENLDLDSADLDKEPEEEPKFSQSLQPDPAFAAPAQAPLFPPTGPVGDPKSQKEQSEIASFASGTGKGGDMDMLSSLAADIKTSKKEVDLSLLRDLKDFRTEGKILENELSDIYTTLNTAMKSKSGQKTAQAKSKKSR